MAKRADKHVVPQVPERPVATVWSHQSLDASRTLCLHAGFKGKTDIHMPATPANRQSPDGVMVWFDKSGQVERVISRTADLDHISRAKDAVNIDWKGAMPLWRRLFWWGIERARVETALLCSTLEEKGVAQALLVSPAVLSTWLDARSPVAPRGIHAWAIKEMNRCVAEGGDSAKALVRHVEAGLSVVDAVSLKWKG